MKNKGFTLIELLLYTSISSMVIMSVVGMLYLTIEAKIKNETVYEVTDNGAEIVQYITQSIQNSNSTDLAKGSNSSSISLTTKDPTKNPTVIVLSGNKINITEGANPAIQLNSARTKITSLTFTNLGNANKAKDSIRVSFTITSNSTSLKNIYNFQTNFYATATLK